MAGTQHILGMKGLMEADGGRRWAAPPHLDGPVGRLCAVRHLVRPGLKVVLRGGTKPGSSLAAVGARSRWKDLASSARSRATRRPPSRPGPAAALAMRWWWWWWPLPAASAACSCSLDCTCPIFLGSCGVAGETHRYAAARSTRLLPMTAPRSTCCLRSQACPPLPSRELAALASFASISRWAISRCGADRNFLWGERVCVAVVFLCSDLCDLKTVCSRKCFDGARAARALPTAQRPTSAHATRQPEPGPLVPAGNVRSPGVKTTSKPATTARWSESIRLGTALRRRTSRLHALLAPPLPVRTPCARHPCIHPSTASIHLLVVGGLEDARRLLGVRLVQHAVAPRRDALGAVLVGTRLVLEGGREVYRLLVKALQGERVCAR